MSFNIAVRSVPLLTIMTLCVNIFTKNMCRLTSTEVHWRWSLLCAPWIALCVSLLWTVSMKIVVFWCELQHVVKSAPLLTIVTSVYVCQPFLTGLLPVIGVIICHRGHYLTEGPCHRGRYQPFAWTQTFHQRCNKKRQVLHSRFKGRRSFQWEI